MVLRVDHDLDAGLRGQQREVVLLLSPEDQADPGEARGEARLALDTPPAPSSGWHSLWVARLAVVRPRHR